MRSLLLFAFVGLTYAACGDDDEVDVTFDEQSVVGEWYLTNLSDDGTQQLFNSPQEAPVESEYTNRISSSSYLIEFSDNGTFSGTGGYSVVSNVDDDPPTEVLVAPENNFGVYSLRGDSLFLDFDGGPIAALRPSTVGLLSGGYRINNYDGNTYLIRAYTASGGIGGGRRLSRTGSIVAQLKLKRP